MSTQVRFCALRGVTLALVAAVLLVCGGPSWGAVVTRGTIHTNSGPAIFEDDLRTILDALIPSTNAQSSLLIFTECFGGDKMDSFASRAGTTVLSATSAGQKAIYGGYDNDAADAWIIQKEKRIPTRSLFWFRVKVLANRFLGVAYWVGFQLRSSIF